MLSRTRGVLLLILALVCGCEASPDTSGPLPSARDLVSAAEASFDILLTVRYELNVSGTIPGLDVREVDGQASRGGLASGHADVQQGTTRFQMTFLVDGPTLYLTDQQGNRTQRPVPAAYAPGVLLDPSRGVPRLLSGATELKTETREDVKGVRTYRITGDLARAVVSSVVPAIQADVSVKFWVTQSEPRQLVRVWMQVPPQQPNEGAVMLELGLSDVNAPMSTVASG
jgi:lipoprotein LprG